MTFCTAGLPQNGKARRRIFWSTLPVEIKKKVKLRMSSKSREQVSMAGVLEKARPIA